MTDVSTPVLPPRWTDIGEQIRKVVTAVNNILRGKTNNTGEVTLRVSQTTTTLTDIRIGINSVIQLMPMTANARTALANVYFDEPGDETVVINHSSSVNADQEFRYTITG